ncbi:uncharacterized protein L969DRAFT_94204 [Mixia osmundae IAM 14324]|uniref:VPS9 domain-containing protein n=1 Tax=Mixia osmundae (strain CBS 9802 / IAM 14324 / JCM 22182 / KY 12970) TaxID=764103 RepID=G7E6H5_MIXOS|nr:uncharacterized protein L969DRAFT_94204 [Mixia osmundae IAM 14324]KEI40408.1 hypothetical protein L969DRAFT_94204 [Mixia osmundae IAM 14324]GAA98435.1 hypothetical protein E5Q_05121 [Mixia osmundae IAM 14324]
MAAQADELDSGAAVWDSLRSHSPPGSPSESHSRALPELPKHATSDQSEDAERSGELASQTANFDPLASLTTAQDESSQAQPPLIGLPMPTSPPLPAPPVGEAPQREPKQGLTQSPSLTFSSIASAFKARLSPSLNSDVASGFLTPSASSPRATAPSSRAGTPESSLFAAVAGRRPQQRSLSGTPQQASQPMLLRTSQQNALPAVQSEEDAPPAAPDPAREKQVTQEDEDVPFDFNRFLEQMRSRQADVIARYLRSFLKEFAKRPWSVNDQIRVINDFLDFITLKMRSCEVWKDASEREFDNAIEAMEKLVMNRLYHLTFTPAIAQSASPTFSTDDLERDQILTQRIQLFRWVSEEHLDLPQAEQTSAFVEFARTELLKINQYKAPRDKLICILNCCKVIFGLIRQLAADQGADTFMPLLIYVVLQANPPHLVSNLQYIQRFRNPERLQGESGYYLSSLNGAIGFIESMDHSSLSNITQHEFEANVEDAIAHLPSESSPVLEPFKRFTRAEQEQPSAAEPDDIAATEADTASALEQPGATLPSITRGFLQKSGDNLTKTVSKPLNAIGKIFDELAISSKESDLRPPSESGTPLPSPARRRGYSPWQAGAPTDRPASAGSSLLPQTQPGDYRPDNQSAATVQAEIDRAHEAAHSAALGTLQQIFPTMTSDVLEIVLVSQKGDLERSIDRLLEM